MKKLLLITLILTCFIIIYGSKVKADNGCNIIQKKRMSYKKYTRKHYKNIKKISFYGKAVQDKISSVNNQVATLEILNPKFR